MCAIQPHKGSKFIPTEQKSPKGISDGEVKSE